jgi:hypothetical protein
MGYAIVWTVVAAVGALVGVLNMYEAYQDKLAVARAGRNGARRLLARSSVWADGLRVLTLTIFALLGVSAFAPSWFMSSLARTILVNAFVVAAAAITANAILAFVVRRRLRTLLQQDQQMLERLRREDVERTRLLDQEKEEVE